MTPTIPIVIERFLDTKGKGKSEEVDFLILEKDLGKLWTKDLKWSWNSNSTLVNARDSAKPEVI